MCRSSPGSQRRFPRGEKRKHEVEWVHRNEKGIREGIPEASSPLRVNISWLYFPDKANDLGISPNSSITCAM